MEPKLNNYDLNCDNIEQRIHQLLDDRLTLNGDPDLMEHAASCAECRKLIDDYDAVDLSFGCHNNIFQNELSPNETSIGAPAMNDQRRRSGRHRTIGVILTFAASLLLVFSIVSNQDFQDRPTAHISRPTVQVASSSFSSPSIESPSVDLGQPRTPTSTLVNSTASQFVPINVNYTGEDQTKDFVRNLVFAQRKSLYEIAQSTPEFVSSVRSSTTPWERISDHLDPLNPILIYSSELPGVRNVQYSVSMTLELLQRSISNRDEPKPNLGFFPDVQQIFKSFA